jgi:hypothetical protein
MEYRRAVVFVSNMEPHRAVVFGVVILIFLLALVNQHDSAESIIAAASENSMSLFDVTYKDENRPDLSPWEQCSIDSISATQPGNLKAFWVPMFPNSDAGMIGTLIRLLTNSPNGHKNYYARATGLKKCKSSNSVTITCEQIHPIVGIGPPPEKQTGSYQSKILLGMRNPLTGIPAHHHSKAILYHSATSQVDIDEWRQFRDQYFIPGVKDQWRRLLTTWKEMEGYDHKPLYLPFEHLLDSVKGPALTERLADELRAAGYVVVSNASCVWYTAVKDQLGGPNHPHYDYVQTYIPSLTQEQKVQLMDELKDIRTIYGTDDSSLDQLLTEYIDTVLKEKRTDIPWVNQTISTTKHGGRL